MLGHGIFSLMQTAVISAVKLEALQGIELFFDFVASKNDHAQSPADGITFFQSTIVSSGRTSTVLSWTVLPASATSDNGEIA